LARSSEARLAYLTALGVNPRATLAYRGKPAAITEPSLRSVEIDTENRAGARKKNIFCNLLRRRLVGDRRVSRTTLGAQLAALANSFWPRTFGFSDEVNSDAPKTQEERQIDTFRTVHPAGRLFIAAWGTWQ
jgi:hypothetical protein